MASLFERRTSRHLSNVHTATEDLQGTRKTPPELPQVPLDENPGSSRGSSPRESLQLPSTRHSPRSEELSEGTIDCQGLFLCSDQLIVSGLRSPESSPSPSNSRLCSKRNLSPASSGRMSPGASRLSSNRSSASPHAGKSEEDSRRPSTSASTPRRSQTSESLRRARRLAAVERDVQMVKESFRIKSMDLEVPPQHSAPLSQTSTARPQRVYLTTREAPQTLSSQDVGRELLQQRVAHPEEAGGLQVQKPAGELSAVGQNYAALRANRFHSKAASESWDRGTLNSDAVGTDSGGFDNSQQMHPEAPRIPEGSVSFSSAAESALRTALAEGAAPPRSPRLGQKAIAAGFETVRPKSSSSRTGKKPKGKMRQQRVMEHFGVVYFETSRRPPFENAGEDSEEDSPVELGNDSAQWRLDNGLPQ